jgi:hypothetical protein
MDQPLPLVTAVCLTGLEPERVKQFLPMTIQCFHQQTYPAGRRELLIVTDGCFDLMPRQQHNIRVLALGSKRPRGALRNLGIEHAQGDFVIQWDEDWHHPERISAQVEAIQQTPEAALILASQVTYCFHRDVAFVRRCLNIREDGMIANLGIHGTVIHRKSALRYPPESPVEDTEFLKEFSTVRMLDTFPSLYVRMCHAGGVSGHEHTMREAANWPTGTYALDQHDMPNLMNALALCMPTGGAASRVEVPVLVEQS